MAQQRSAAHVALGRALRTLRSLRAISQEELALRSKLQRKTIYQLEGGKTDPRFESLRRVSEGLEIRVTELIALADELEVKASGARRRKPDGRK